MSKWKSRRARPRTQSRIIWPLSLCWISFPLPMLFLQSGKDGVPRLLQSNRTNEMCVQNLKGRAGSQCWNSHFSFLGGQSFFYSTSQLIGRVPPTFWGVICFIKFTYLHVNITWKYHTETSVISDHIFAHCGPAKLAPEINHHGWLP